MDRNEYKEIVSDFEKSINSLRERSDSLYDQKRDMANEIDKIMEKLEALKIGFNSFKSIYGPLYEEDEPR